MIHALYRPSLALLTDLYELTMGYGYWRQRMHDRGAAFHLFFRTAPFGGGYAIAAGLASAVDWMRSFEVTAEDIQYLRSIEGNDGEPMFADDFLRAIEGMRLELDVDAVPEGTAVFANEPIVRVCGPLWQCQWVETALLNVVNFQTLIATKASRVCRAAEGDSVLEFGLRRAQGIDGGMSAARAAFIGGCGATSNVLAGKHLGIPVKGTHAHSWVMAFDEELESFRAYADAMPNNCVFLVDTFDSIEGVRNAIRVGKQLREMGHEMVGIRLDSGDLGELSVESRRMLDEAGFPDAVIVASNDLDEDRIAELKRRGATIAVWGVGTRLVTGGNQPALGGVYKLAAVEGDSGHWQPRIKLSEQEIKTSTPGVQQIRRYFRDGEMLGDVIFSELIGPPATATARSMAADQRNDFSDASESRDLLRPVLRGGELQTPLPELSEIQAYAFEQRRMIDRKLQLLPSGQSYPVGLELRLFEQKRRLMEEA